MNRNLIDIVFISILINVCSASYAQDVEYTKLNNEDSFELKLKEVSTGLSSISADFSQSKHMQFLDSELVSSGGFWFKSPDKVRWEYTSPYNYTVVINSGTLKLISDESENAFDMNSSEVFGQVNDLMLAAVSGNIFQNTNYTTEVFESNDFYLVILTPGNATVSELIQKMELYFNKQSFRIEQMKMIEPSTDYSLITFTNQKINEAIADSIFNP